MWGGWEVRERGGVGGRRGRREGGEGGGGGGGGGGVGGGGGRGGGVRRGEECACPTAVGTSPLAGSSPLPLHKHTALHFFTF